MTHNLFVDYLSVLQVPFTEDFSTKQFDSMPFQTLFGLSKLLESYGVDSVGYFLPDKSAVEDIPTPFIARTRKGMVIVTSISPSGVDYLTQGQPEHLPLADFVNAFDGNVLLSYPAKDAAEPDYKMHTRLDFLMKSKKWVLWACFLFIFAYFFIANGIYQHISAIFVAAIDIAGLYFTYLLVQKSANIKNPAADRVCGVLQAGGCDSILEMKASKFFGLFGWSEVGFSYFSVSLITLLFFPSMLPWLALCNICCLPFTLWSIWYQKFRAHKWCTLCVCVQASLWLLFFSYLSGGWIRDAWPLDIRLFVLGAAYLGVMLALNAIIPLMDKGKDSM